MAEVAPWPDWEALSDEQLDAMERRIAAKYMRKFPQALCFGVYEYGGVACLWPLALQEPYRFGWRFPLPCLT